MWMFDYWPLSSFVPFSKRVQSVFIWRDNARLPIFLDAFFRVRYLDIIEHALNIEGVAFARLDGTCSLEDRQGSIDRFQKPGRLAKKGTTGWWQLKYLFIFTPESWRKWSNLTDSIFQMGWKYQLVDDNKFSSWHVKLNIPMYKCIYNTIALLQYFEASQIGVLKFPSLNGVTDMSWSLWLSRGSGVDVFLLSMKAGGNLAQSHQGKNPREGPSFEIPMLTQKNVLDHHVLMRCLCNTTARSIQVTFK